MVKKNQYHVFVADEAVPLIKNLMRPYSRKKSGSYVNKIFSSVTSAT
jgi:hypothetical protein